MFIRSLCAPGRGETAIHTVPVEIVFEIQGDNSGGVAGRLGRWFRPCPGTGEYRRAGRLNAPLAEAVVQYPAQPADRPTGSYRGSLALGQPGDRKSTRLKSSHVKTS